MKFKACLGSTLAILLCAVSLQAQSRETLLKYITENPDWTPAGSAKQFDQNTLATVAGKTAPTIKRYGVTGITVQDWTSKLGRMEDLEHALRDLEGVVYGSVVLILKRRVTAIV